VAIGGIVVKGVVVPVRVGKVRPNVIVVLSANPLARLTGAELRPVRRERRLPPAKANPNVVLIAVPAVRVANFAVNLAESFVATGVRAAASLSIVRHTSVPISTPRAIPRILDLPQL
jgi:hypothetical protein